MGKRSALLRRAGTETASQFYSYETALRISGQGPVNKTTPDVRKLSFRVPFVPEGRTESSPVIHRRGSGPNRVRRPGRDDRSISLRKYAFTRPSGTENSFGLPVNRR